MIPLLNTVHAQNKFQLAQATEWILPHPQQKLPEATHLKKWMQIENNCTITFSKWFNFN